MTCPACHREVAQGVRFCPECGAALSLSATPTRSHSDSPAPGTPSGGAHEKTPSAAGRPPSSSSSIDQGRFVPGTLLADRYRIVALAGKGGMGEVYRAEDLKLGQAVSLKFLPEALAADAAALARFHREVRIARQVSHPNVCRVFDIGEADGHVFLSMEYVDGEDLASLLRRIGRLPQDKAVEIARQMCAGLAAAHEFGVLHRDLKPSNVMLDGRGKARITDFGLAGLANEFRPDELRAGTPAYMAPEQLEGKDVTVRSDIFSLGLVLYELFTGKRAFDAPTMLEWRRLREESAPASPVSVVKDLDPAVERAILRCLEKDPRKRPASALQVAAALPGGDPLAAALAAGETPSPEMVAASGETEGIRPAYAWACLAAVVVFTIACVVLAGRAKLYRLAPIEKPPEALAERAQEILRSIGYTEKPTDTAMSFTEDFDFLRYIARTDASKTRWQNLEVGAFNYWYRTSPRPLEPQVFFLASSSPGAASPSDPPLDQSGMSLVWLSPRGRLLSLTVVPPQFDESPGPAPAVDWAPLFAAAGLDPAQWTPAQPFWTPYVYADTRAAWTGKHPERPGISMRIEAAAYHGKPVSFDLIGPWKRPDRAQLETPSVGVRVAQSILLSFFVAMAVGGLLLARRNLRAGRGDRRGAFRLAASVVTLVLLGWVLAAHHVPNFDELGLFVIALSGALFLAAFAWMIYVALEPYVRRRWPATLVSWTRLLAGGFRDPLVGRDLLAGLLLGSLSIVIARSILLAPTWFGATLQLPYTGPTDTFLGARVVLSTLLGGVFNAIGASLTYLFVLFLLRAVLRREWLAATVLVILLTLATSLQSPTPLVTGLANGVTFSASVVLLTRFGLLALLVSEFAGSVISNLPLTTDFSVWYAGISSGVLAVLIGLAAYSFYISLGGQPLFGSASLEE